MQVVHAIKQVNDLSEPEIETILKHWDIDEWKTLRTDEFRQLFQQSEFHLLMDTNLEIRCLARINFEFAVRIQDKVCILPELVGLVAIEPRKGYGKQLVNLIQESVKSRTIELISFCEHANRKFYQKCGIPILADKAKYLREPANNNWLIPTDDDILAINLSERNVNLLNSLNSENLGYLIIS